MVTFLVWAMRMNMFYIDLKLLKIKVNCILLIVAGYGSGMDVVWSSKDLYAYREGKTIIVNKGANNQEVTKMEVDYQIEDLFGGPLL